MPVNRPPLRLISLWASGALMALLAFVGACAANLPATLPPTVDPADLTATALCIQLTDTGQTIALWEIFGTPTPRPDATLVTPTPRTLSAVGDAQRGAAVFAGAGNCATCHNTADEETFVGPSLRSIANRAAYKRPGMDAATYLYNAIVSPDEIIIPLTKPGIMPRTYAQTLTEQQIADVVAYLLTLTG